jgi:hypothetical protein
MPSTPPYVNPPPAPATIQLASQTFRKVRGSGTLPAKPEGLATVCARNVQANSLVVAVNRGRQPGTVIAQPPAVAAVAAHNPLIASSLGAQHLRHGVLRGGRARCGSTPIFQLSFNSRFFADDAALACCGNFLSDLYDLESAPAPFYETSYKPRLFHLNEDAGDRPGRNVILGVEAGWDTNPTAGAASTRAE